MPDTVLSAIYALSPLILTALRGRYRQKVIQAARGRAKIKPRSICHQKAGLLTAIHIAINEENHHVLAAVHITFSFQDQ